MLSPAGWWVGGNFFPWNFPHNLVRFRRQNWFLIASPKRRFVLTACRPVFLKLYYAHKSSGDIVKNVDSHPAGLGWGLRFCLSESFQVILMLLVLGPYFEKQRFRVLSCILYLEPKFSTF